MESTFHEAKCDLELDQFTIMVGDIFEVIDDESFERFEVKTRGGQKGFISATNYRCSNCLTKTGWYLPHISRRKTIKLLKEEPMVGTFLVRNSEQHGIQYDDHCQTLSVKSGADAVRHYRIYRTQHYFITPYRLFDTLSELVAHYFDSESKSEIGMTIPIHFNAALRHLDEHELEKKEKLGSGHFGEVFGGVSSEHARPIAIKSLKPDSSSDKSEEFQTEAELLSKLSHVNVVSLYGVVGRPIRAIVLELLTRGSLQNHLRANSKVISLRDQIHWCHDIASGLHYLAQERIVHRDIAARNVLLSAKKIGKLGDFGMARRLDGDSEYFQLEGAEKLPVRWLSPEASSKWIFSHASDVWALGVTMWEICALGERPYRHLHNREISKAVRNGHRLEKSVFSCNQKSKNAKQFYAKLYSILSKAWNSEAEDRPTPQEVRFKVDKLFHHFL